MDYVIVGLAVRKDRQGLGGGGGGGGGTLAFGFQGCQWVGFVVGFGVDFAHFGVKIGKAVI